MQAYLTFGADLCWITRMYWRKNEAWITRMYRRKNVSVLFFAYNTHAVNIKSNFKAKNPISPFLSTFM